MCTWADDDFYRQGLEFVRVYMRVSLTHEAREHNKQFSSLELYILQTVIMSVRREHIPHPALKCALLNNTIDLHSLITALTRETSQCDIASPKHP